MEAGFIGKLGNGRRICAILGLAGLLLLSQAGCTRRFFRQCADREVTEVLTQKDRFPEWKIENFHVYPDPRARFADPTNPDRPPMPPDDAAAQWLGPNPQRPCKAGIARIENDAFMTLLAQWDAENRARMPAEKKNSSLPQGIGAVYPSKGKAPSGDIQLANFQVKEGEQKKGVEQGLYPRRNAADPDAKTKGFLLRLDQAVELGLFNSREYQARREDLYLTALPVTVERFAFGPQFLALTEAIREHTGTETSQGHGDRWRLNSTLGVGKLFSTGALLLVGFANRTVIELTDITKPHTLSVSTVNLDIVQPLLVGGGRAVTLEPLTQAERNLLYEIRDYARFRKEYFQYITAGATGGGSVSVGGVGAGGVAFAPGSVTLGTGNPARLDIRPGGAGRIDLGISSIAAAEGFLPTILKGAELKNEFKNERFLTDLLKLFRAIEEGGELSSLQVDQVEIDLLGSRTKIQQQEQGVDDSVDRFKLQLGLPTNVPLELDDEVLEPINRQLEQYELVLKQYENIVKFVDKRDNPADAVKLRGALEEFLTKSPLVQKTKTFRVTFPQRWDSYKKLDDKSLDQRLEKERAERRTLLEDQAKLEADQAKLEEKQAKLAEKGQALSAEEQEQVRALDKNLADLEKTLLESERKLRVGHFEFYLRKYEQKPKDAGRFRDVRNAFVLVLSEVTNERIALLRATWPELPPVTLEGVNALEADLDRAHDVVTRTALANRLDLMNERASMHDAWRQVAIFANSLLGVFNVGYHLDSSTPPDAAKPLAFAGSRTRHQLFLNAELPLVRLAERNSYRASLIAFQRARRNLMEAEDRVALEVRSDLRQVRTLAQNFKIQQRTVELQYQQVENSLETLTAPADPLQAQRGSAANAAALTQQVLNAQRGLVGAQNQLYRNWLNYLINRQRLYLDLELMPLDPRGVWIDEYATPQPAAGPGDNGNPAPALLPIIGQRPAQPLTAGAAPVR